MNVADITITSIETITGFGLTTGSYLFTLDEIQDATINNTQETQEITGKGGRKLSNLKKTKGVTISGTNGMLSAGLLEVQSGGTFANKATNVLWTDYLTTVTESSTTVATTSYKAIGTAGAEIEELYIKNSDGTIGTELVQDASAASGKFAYDPSTKKLTFHTNVTAGTEIVVIYKRKITANVLSNDSDKFSTKCTLYVDALGEDKCGNVYRVQFFIPKADFSGEYSIEMGDNQTTHEFEAESLVGSCVSGSSNALWTYTVFGVNTNDAA